MGGSLLFSRRHPAQLIALLSLIVVGAMCFVKWLCAGGGMTFIDITIRDGMDTQAVCRSRHPSLMHSSLQKLSRTLAALGGLLAVIASISFKPRYA